MCIIEIESTRFNSPPPDIGTKRKLEKREHVCRAARDREGSGGEKKPFPIVATIFKSQTRGGGEEEGTANPSARGVNRDKRRIVLRIQSVTIRAAYGVREGRGHDVTIRGNAHWLKQAYLERNKFHDKLEGFRYDLRLF